MPNLPELNAQEITLRVTVYCRHLMTEAELAAQECVSIINAMKRIEKTLANPQPLQLHPDAPEHIKEILHTNVLFAGSEMEQTTAMRQRLAEYADKLKTLWTPEVAALLKAGRPAFYDTMYQRILQEHRDAVVNPCPRCGGLTRTPKARQCPHCFHDWH